jgi:transcriptional antiterminator NusG
MNEIELEESTELKAESITESNIDGMRWYVVQAYSGFEKQVQKSLQAHIDRSDLNDQFGQVLVPTEDVVEMKNGQKRTSERKFFPGYVLVQMIMSEITWHLVKSVPRVSGFVGGTSAQPVPISDREASAILQQVVEGAEHPRPKYTFAPGEVVRVTDGPFQEFNGTVEDVNFDKSKLRVAVTIFGRSTPVELSFSQVEKG